VDEMSTQLVAGTIMLNRANGEKKFLVKEEQSGQHFVTTKMNQEYTSLANILQALKLEVLVDIHSMDLVELTTICLDDRKIPLYVFEMEETQWTHELENGYTWAKPSTLRNLLKNFSISDVPIFE